MKTGWHFDNSYVTLPRQFFSRLDPVPVKNPRLVALNEELAKKLGLEADDLRSDENVAIFAGNRLPSGAAPLAQAYAGHQFGHFTMLGDGRAILLGEQLTPQGKRFDIQLKGSGPTPYSRGGDGRAALGPMLREYVISEAMHGLGIPTTRSLAVVTTGEYIFREKPLPGAILTRVAQSHLRVGTFQYAAAFGSREQLESLADYALKRHVPEADLKNPQRFLQLLQYVIDKQASLVAAWQLVGFVHGVMNTDNMTISGETIDYGPCAFMDVYDPNTVFSSIDDHGRYRYGNQPSIAGWNLARFAETLVPLLDEDEKKAVDMAQEAVSAFPKLYEHYWLSGMRAKLGLHNGEEEDLSLIQDLLGLMKVHRADYTNTFRQLILYAGKGGQRPQTSPAIQQSDGQGNDPVGGSLVEIDAWALWHRRWQARLARQPQSVAEVQKLMEQANPVIIPRNHRVEEALTAAVDNGDYSLWERLGSLLKDPYTYSPEKEPYTAPPAPSATPYVTYCGT